MKHNRVLLGFLAAVAAMMFLFCGDNIVKVPADGTSGSEPGTGIDNPQTLDHIFIITGGGNSSKWENKVLSKATASKAGPINDIIEQIRKATENFDVKKEIVIQFGKVDSVGVLTYTDIINFTGNWSKVSGITFKGGLNGTINWELLNVQRYTGTGNTWRQTGSIVDAYGFVSADGKAWLDGNGEGFILNPNGSVDLIVKLSSTVTVRVDNQGSWTGSGIGPGSTLVITLTDGSGTVLDYSDLSGYNVGNIPTLGGAVEKPVVGELTLTRNIGDIELTYDLSIGGTAYYLLNSASVRPLESAFPTTGEPVAAGIVTKTLTLNTTTPETFVWVLVKDADGNRSEIKGKAIPDYSGPPPAALALDNPSISRLATTFAIKVRTTATTNVTSYLYYNVSTTPLADLNAGDWTDAPGSAATISGNSEVSFSITSVPDDANLALHVKVVSIDDATLVATKEIAVPTNITTIPSVTVAAANRTDAISGTVTFTSDEAGNAFAFVQNAGLPQPSTSDLSTWSPLGPVGTTAQTLNITLTTTAADVWVAVKNADEEVSPPASASVPAFVAGPNVTVRVERDDHNNGSLEITATQSGKAYYILNPAGGTAPTLVNAFEGKPNVDLVKDFKTTVPLTTLIVGENTIYVAVIGSSDQWSDIKPFVIDPYYAPLTITAVADDGAATGTPDGEITVTLGTHGAGDLYYYIDEEDANEGPKSGINGAFIKSEGEGGTGGYANILATAPTVDISNAPTTSYGLYIVIFDSENQPSRVGYIYVNLDPPDAPALPTIEQRKGADTILVNIASAEPNTSVKYQVLATAASPVDYSTAIAATRVGGTNSTIFKIGPNTSVVTGELLVVVWTHGTGGIKSAGPSPVLTVPAEPIPPVVTLTARYGSEKIVLNAAHATALTGYYHTAGTSIDAVVSEDNEVTLSVAGSPVEITTTVGTVLSYYFVSEDATGNLSDVGTEVEVDAVPTVSTSADATYDGTSPGSEKLTIDTKVATLTEAYIIVGGTNAPDFTTIITNANKYTSTDGKFDVEGALTDNGKFWIVIPSADGKSFSDVTGVDFTI